MSASSPHSIYRAELYAATEKWLHPTIAYLLGLEEQYAALKQHDDRLSELNTEMATRLDELEEQLEAAQKALDDACDVAIWLSGLDCLRTNSEAWRTWEDSMRPKLFKALDARTSDPVGE